MHRLLLPAALLVLLASTVPAFAKGGSKDNDRVSFGSNITIAEGENAGDVVCFFCSVKVQGDIAGDTVVFFGNVTVDYGRKIGGDVAIIGGDLNLSEEAVTGGDVSVIAGNANLAQNAVIHGSRTIMPGTFWLLVPFIPLLVLIGIIWLIVRLFRRNRYRYPAYPPGTSYPPPPPPR
ncbi:MAG TPA: hypothetical protein VF214_10025 [Edaphobacter sp.]